MRLIFFLSAILLLASCSNNGENSKNLPNASGISGELFLIMDSTQWKGPVGRTIDSIFSVDMPGLPRTEPSFKLRWINPTKLNFVLKRNRNLIFATTLDQKTEAAAIVRKLFTPASIEKIKVTPDEFVNTNANVFAMGQEVMYLFGNDQAILLKNLRKNGSKLSNFFNVKERERITKSIFRVGTLKGMSDVLAKEYQCDLKVPFGFKLVQKGPDFVWLRQINQKDDKNLFIARKRYVSQDDFKKENLIKFRDEVCHQYLFEDPAQPDTYLLTETNVPFIPVTADTVSFNKNFAIQLRGLWRSHTFGLGGPFEGFAMVDEAAQQFYYVEGFIFSPGKDQREIMREMETILYTFRTSKDLPKKEESK